jgi:hypothetical protein
MVEVNVRGNLVSALRFRVFAGKQLVKVVSVQVFAKTQRREEERMENF